MSANQLRTIKMIKMNKLGKIDSAKIYRNSFS